MARLPPPSALLVAATFALVPAAVAADEPPVRTANDGAVLLSGVPEIPADLVRRIDSYQNVRSASLADWSRGGSVYVLTRFGDTNQLHRVDAPLGARHQLTFFPEPVRGAERRPGHDELLLSMDEGGSEFYQLHLFDPASGRHRRLTDGSSRNGSAVFSRDGARLAYQSTRRDGKSNDVWVLDLDRPDEARLLVQADDGSFWGPADWSPDGRSLLVLQYVSVADSRIHLVDVATGERRLVAGGERGPGNHSDVSPRFTADGAAFFLSTDVGSEFSRLARQQVADGEQEIVTDDIDWDVEGLALSEDGTRAAFVVNAGGLSRLYRLDPATLQHEELPGLPTGVFGAGRFSPDGRSLALALNTPGTPSDVFVLALPDDAPAGGDPPPAAPLVRWTRSELGGLDPASFVEPELVHLPTFDEVDGRPRQVPAFVYRPRGKGPFPVVVSIHGGPEGQARPTFNTTYQQWLTELGAAVVVPNVRGSTGYGKAYVALDDGLLREDSVKDLGAVLDWIATQPDLDDERVAVYGGSYGGYMVLAACMHYGERLAAAVDLVGISNFVTFLESTQEYRRDLRRVEYGDERDPEMRAFLQAISPTTNADRLATPLFVAQGNNDPRVPASEAEQIVQAVRRNGHDVWYMNALDEGHGFSKKQNRDLYNQAVMLFFEQHLLPRAEE